MSNTLFTSQTVPWGNTWIKTLFWACMKGIHYVFLDLSGRIDSASKRPWKCLLWVAQQTWTLATFRQVGNEHRDSHCGVLRVSWWWLGIESGGETVQSIPKCYIRNIWRQKLIDKVCLLNNISGKGILFWAGKITV